MFGFLTIYNLRQKRFSRQRNVTSNFRRHRIRDFQRMILIQTICLIILTFPYIILQLHRTVTRFHRKNSE
jgi:hypothetical protein